MVADRLDLLCDVVQDLFKPVSIAYVQFAFDCDNPQECFGSILKD